MTERESRQVNTFNDREGLPTDEQDLNNLIDTYTITMFSVEELETINQAAEAIQITLKQGSDGAIAEVPMPDEPEPPLSDKQLVQEGEEV